MRPRLLILLALLVLVVAGAVYRVASRRPPPDLVLISVDTLRPDRLGYAGYSRDTSPELDALARDGVVFANAHSQSGWTLPAMATVLTGLHPYQHGAVRFDTMLRPGLPTLATILDSAGYDTRAWVSHSLVSATYGLDRGFGRFDSSVLERGHPGQVTTSAELTDRVLGELDDLGHPYFLWVHYFDPHALYLAHDGFDFGPAEADRYDGEIAHNDRQIGRLLGGLDSRGLLDRAVVVFTADHGEELGEHGGQYHFTVHQEVLRVPLVIRAPSIPPRVVAEPVDQIDLLPTLLRLLGQETRVVYPGRDLLAPDVEERPIFVERLQPNAFRQRAVIAGDLKLIAIDENPDPAPYAGRFEYDELARVEPGLSLFDLAADPGETENLIARRPADARRLLALLEERLGEVELPGPTLEVTEEMEEHLRGLGYIE